MQDAISEAPIDDYDLFSQDYVRDPAEYWQRFRDECHVAQSSLYGGSFMPVRYDEVVATARDIETFTSSKGVSIVQSTPTTDMIQGGSPPIEADPPKHTWTRRLLLPAMAPQSVMEHEPYTRDLCRRLIANFIDKGRTDAATDYAQQMPVRVIGAMLGIDEGRSDQLVTWVRAILEFANDAEGRANAVRELRCFFEEEIAKRRANPGEDLLTKLLAAGEHDERVTEDMVIGQAILLLVAGVDTTWSAISSAMYHLATHPDDRRRLAQDPDLLPTAIEEFLRFYSPLQIGRIATDDTTLGGCPIPKDSRVVLNFGAANRDPDAFEHADTFIIDRARNRHIAFGVGIHRCAGSNLARMELTVALEEWMAAIPEFELSDKDAVVWSTGTVRGPRSVPVAFPVQRGVT